MRTMTNAEHVEAHVIQKKNKTFIHQTTNCAAYKALFCYKKARILRKHKAGKYRAEINSQTWANKASVFKGILLPVVSIFVE